MKLNVTRQELDECIANAVSKVLKEYDFDDFDDFSDDDMLDSTLDDPELRQALSGTKAKKAKKMAKAQGEKEIASAEKDDKISNDEDTIGAPEVDDSFSEEDIDDEDGEGTNTVTVNDLMRQAAENETDPLFVKCIEAGVPLENLYRHKGNNQIVKRALDDVNLEFMAKHPMVGRKVDPLSSIDLTFGTDGNNYKGDMRFKAKGGFSRDSIKKTRADAEADGERFL